MSRHVRRHDPRVRSTAARTAALGTLVALVAVVGTAATHAAFTDSSTADLGVVGGSYELALVGPDGELVPGDPDPLVVDLTDVELDARTALEVGVVTTTPATGPVTLTIRNARAEALPTDPGTTGPGAEPFEVALFTVSVDGETVLESVPGSDLGPVVIDDWETGVPRPIRVAAALPPALGNPYFSGRAMVVDLQLDGSTS